MTELPSFLSLVESFSRLPGVGRKSAERMAYSILEMKEEDAFDFAKAIQDVKSKIHKCPNCGLYAEKELCDVCADQTRDCSTCIVLSYPKDVLAFEKLNDFHGIYDVLGGVIAPSKGVGPEDLDIDHLISRIDTEGIKEIVIATSPTLEGETTALFIAKLLQGKDVAITRLAYGLPMGASLDYADSLTLTRALQGRTKI